MRIPCCFKIRLKNLFSVYEQVCNNSSNSRMKLYLALLAVLGLAASQHDPHFTQNRTTIVHLMEWRWNDIADECERFLGPFGYGGVQTSPANENVIYPSLDHVTRPWWERYQPVSYKLETRSGTEEEFKSMVRRCNAVGVRIYVDVVINHMSIYWYPPGVGTGGSTFDPGNYAFPIYSSNDFNVHGECPTASGEIDDYQNVDQMRNCRLGGLLDLNPSTEYVRATLAAFMNKLGSYGVAGFRVDAAKHMWPADLQNIFNRMNNLPTDHGFPSGAKPFVYQEVIDYGEDNIKASEYFGIGRVTEFKVCGYVGDIIRKRNQKLSYVKNWGEGWGFMPNDEAVVFVDNHDNQRNGAAAILSFRQDRMYKMAQAFVLSFPYGLTRVMSSFYWDQDFENGRDKNEWFGPPHDANYNTLPVTVNPDHTCNNGWVCEHRWRQIFNMVAFRNYVGDAPLLNWHDNGENQIAYSRGDRGFIVFNNDDFPLYETLQTGMAPGKYCDLISGDLENGVCTGKIVEVDQQGRATLFISELEADPMLAIHAGRKF